MSGAGFPRAISSPPTSAAKRGNKAVRTSFECARSRRVDVATARAIPRPSSQSMSSNTPGLIASPSRSTISSYAACQRAELHRPIAGTRRAAPSSREVADHAACHQRHVTACRFVPARAASGSVSASGRPCRRSPPAAGDERSHPARVSMRRRASAPAAIPPRRGRVRVADAVASASAAGRRSKLQEAAHRTCGFSTPATTTDRLT